MRDRMEKPAWTVEVKPARRARVELKSGGECPIIGRYCGRKRNWGVRRQFILTPTHFTAEAVHSFQSYLRPFTARVCLGLCWQPA